MKKGKTKNTIKNELNNINTNDKDKTNSLLFENGITCKWLSTRTAASYLGISSNALRILVHRGRIKAHKLGARLKFRISDLNDSLQMREA